MSKKNNRKKREDNRMKGLDALKSVTREIGTAEELAAIDEERKAEEKRRKKEQNSGRHAPYNFVGIEKVYQFDEDDRISHNAIDEELFSGEIEYTITAQTDIFVGEEDSAFYRDARGRFAIPGSTVRGLIRNNVQILSFSGYEDDVSDYRLMFRDVATNGSNKRRYNDLLGTKQISVKTGDGQTKQTSILTNVKAGYICKDGQNYYIYRTMVDYISEALGSMNYYILSERAVLRDRNKFKPLFERNTSYLANNKIIGKNKVKSNPDYRPFYFRISYQLSGERNIERIDEPGILENEGYIMGAGKMDNKKVLYVIPEVNEEADVIPIGKRELREFKIDYRSRENTLAKDDPVLKHQITPHDYFDLPVDDEIKPVFYIEIDGKLYFGFTPRLRLQYDYSIKDGINVRHKLEEKKIDFAKSMFGYSTKKGSYKSKVSFTDAVIDGKTEEEDKTRLVLASPKPTFYNAYLKPKNGGPMTYNMKGFELRGIKQYWLHEKASPKNTGNDNEKVYSEICPLTAGTSFKGRIRFDNLTPKEMGLLLWSISPSKDALMNIGKAKAYGYGVIRIEVNKVQKFAPDKMLASGSADLFRVCEQIDEPAMIETYKRFIRDVIGIDPVESSQIANFLRMKDPALIPDDEDISYMTLEEHKEFKNKVEQEDGSKKEKVLPEITDIVVE